MRKRILLTLLLFVAMATVGLAPMSRFRLIRHEISRSFRGGVAPKGRCWCADGYGESRELFLLRFVGSHWKENFLPDGSELKWMPLAHLSFNSRFPLAGGTK